MSKMFYFMALVALVALLACGGDDATEEPAADAGPGPRATPTAMVVSTPELAPTDTSVPEPTNTPDVLWGGVRMRTELGGPRGRRIGVSPIPQLRS
jgi:hypothetical protein